MDRKRVALQLVRLAKSLVAAEPYKTVNDAAEAYPELSSLAKGNTEIWYMDKSFIRDGLMGYKNLEKKGMLPDPENLDETHVLLGKIKENDKEDIFGLMQGGNWSPMGEANGLIGKKGLRHTSMSVGDIIKIGNKVLMVDGMGFKEL